jgi:hypothetical protein
VDSVELRRVKIGDHVCDFCVNFKFKLSEDSSASRLLNWIDDKVISNAQCAQTFGSYIKATTICTFTPLKSACNVRINLSILIYFYRVFGILSG